jgi:hypothetical protein
MTDLTNVTVFVTKNASLREVSFGENVPGLCRRPPDSLSDLTDARGQAIRIQAFWLQRGFKSVKVWVDKVAGTVDAHGSLYQIRSNLKNGCPPDA